MPSLAVKNHTASDGRLYSFLQDLESVVGARRHYSRTAEAWLENLDTNRAEALAILGSEATLNE